ALLRRSWRLWRPVAQIRRGRSTPSPRSVYGGGTRSHTGRIQPVGRGPATPGALPRGTPPPSPSPAAAAARSGRFPLPSPSAGGKPASAAGLGAFALVAGRTRARQDPAGI